jgi:hypothetical protein
VHNRDKEGFTKCYMQLVLKEESSQVIHDYVGGVCGGRRGRVCVCGGREERVFVRVSGVCVYRVCVRVCGVCVCVCGEPL